MAGALMSSGSTNGQWPVQQWPDRQPDAVSSILPMPFVDETLASLVVRLGRINGFANWVDAMPTVFPGYHGNSLFNTPIDLPTLCSQTRGAYGGPETVIRDMTLLDWLAVLGWLSPEYSADLATGRDRATVKQLSFPADGVPRYCPECRTRELDTLGVTYWHRTHQIPIVLVCPEHRVQLCDARASALRTLFSAPLPGDVDGPIHNRPSFETRSQSFWETVSVFTTNAVLAPVLFDGEFVRATLIDALRERRLTSDRGVVRVQEVAYLLRETSGEMPRSLAVSERAKSCFMENIVKSICQPQRRTPFGQMIVMSWLFGHWSAFLEWYRWIRAFGNPYATSSRLNNAGNALGAMTSQCREKCVAYLREHPEGTRFSFTRADYRTFRWLCRNDSDWLDDVLPQPGRNVGQRELFSQQ